MSQSPFKFLDSYTKEDKDVFFGRDKEIEELYHRIFESKILMIFGVSGTGKSSLINCGLANKFQDSDWLPIFIRRGNDINASLRNTIAKEALTGVKSDRSLNKVIQSLYLDHFKPIYLIFDQFEELFIFGSAKEKQAFVGQIKALLESDLNCKFIFSMREEYLANITEFEHDIPTFLANRIRIEKMTKYTAREVIEGPCKVYNIKVEEGFAEKLLDKLSPQAANVELTYLQVFLDKIFRLAKKNGDKAIIFSNSILEGLGKVGDILGDFLEEQIAELDDPDTALVILKAFVSPRGTKKQVAEGDIIEFCSALGKELNHEVLRDFLQKFINLRIIRDKDENENYELRHDSLAEKIFEKITVVEKELLEVRQFIENAYDNYQKREILLSEADLKYIAPYEDKLFLHRKLEKFIDASKHEIKKAKIRRRQIGVTIAVILFIILSGFTVWALVERDNAQKQKNIAISNAMVARSNELASYCMLNLERNPTLSFRLAEEAFRTQQSKLAMEALSLAYETATYNPLHLNLEGHQGTVYSLDYDPVTKNIVSGSFDGTARLWSIDGKELHILEGHQNALFSVSFSNDGKFVLTASGDSTARIWDNSGNLLYTIKDSSQWIYLADFSHDGSFIVTASVMGKATIWNFDKAGHRCDFAHHLIGHESTVNSINISSDDKYIVTTSKDHTARIWNFQGSNLAVLKGHTDLVRHSAFSPDNEQLITSSDDKTARIWDIKGNQLKELKEHTGGVTRSSFSPDGSYIITVSRDGRAIVWEREGIMLRELRATLAGIERFDISPDSKFIATAADNGICQVWQFPGDLLYELKRHESVVWSIKFIENDKIITGSQDETLKIWSVGNREVKQFRQDIKSILNAKRYGEKTKELVVTKHYGGKSASLSLWDITNDALFNFENYYGTGMKAEFSADGKYLASASQDKTARIWTRGGKQLARLDHSHPVSGVSFSPDGKTLITSGGDGYIYSWDITGKSLCSGRISFESLNSAVFSPNGRNIIAASKEKTITILDHDMNILKVLKGHKGEVTKALYSPDGEIFVSGSADGNAIIWDKSGQQLKVLSGHSTAIVELDFSKSGNYFYSMSEKPYLIQIWDRNGELQIVINLGKAPDTEHYAQFAEESKELIVFTNTRGRIFVKRWPFVAEQLLIMVNDEKVLGDARELSEEEKIEFNLSN